MTIQISDHGLCWDAVMQYESSSLALTNHEPVCLATVGSGNGLQVKSAFLPTAFPCTSLTKVSVVGGLSIIFLNREISLLLLVTVEIAFYITDYVSNLIRVRCVRV